jgi:hypothetical protein
MSFSRELKDFVSAFQAGSKLYQDAEWNKARINQANAHSEYYRAAAAKAGKPGEVDPVEAARQAGRQDFLTGAAPNPGGAVGGATGGDANSTWDSPAPAPGLSSAIKQHVPPAMQQYATTMGMKESGGRAGAVSPTGATGFFQFIKSTGAQYGLVGPQGDRRRDPVANTRAFVALTRDNFSQLQQRLGRTPTWSELALAHQQGVGGAAALITGKGPINQRNLDVNQGGKGGNALLRIKKYYGLPDTPAKIAELEAVAGEGEEGALPEAPTTMMAASGGMVERPDDETHAQFWQQERSREQADIPAVGAREAQSPAPQQAAPQADGSIFSALGKAIAGGLDYLQEAFGIKQAQAGAIPAQGDAAQAGNGAIRLMRGEGAASPQEQQAVRKTVDPDGELTESLANIAGLARVYQYHLDKGDLNAANKAAATLIQSARVASMKYGSIAEVAVRNGDMPGAIAALKKAYDAIPDGRDVQVQGDTATVTNAQGKPIERFKLTPQVILDAATRMRGGEFYTHLARVTGEETQQQGLSEDEFSKRLNPGAAPAQPAPPATVPATTTPAVTAPAETAAPAVTPAAAAPAVDPATQKSTEVAPTGALPLGGNTAPAATPAPTPAVGAVSTIPMAAPVPPQPIDTRGMSKEQLQHARFANQQSMERYRQEMTDYRRLVTEAYREGRIDRRERERIESDLRRDELTSQRNEASDLRRSQREEARDVRTAQRADVSHARQTERAELSAMRQKEFAEAVPRNIDSDDDEVVGKFSSVVMKTAAADSGLDEKQIKEQFGPRGLERLRNATMELWRYNKSLAPDTASRIAQYMARPFGPDVDENPAAAPFTITPLKNLPRTGANDQRVAVQFWDAEFPPVVLPKSMVTQLDIVRGERARMQEKSLQDKTMRDIKDRDNKNRWNELNSKKIENQSERYQRARKTWANRGRQDLSEGN